MRKAEVLDLIGNSGLPGAVKEYLAQILATKTPSALKAGLKKAPAALAGDIDRLLTRAGALSGCPKEEVLFITGFNKNDLAPERFEAAMAELRALVFLSRQGFSGLKFIRQTRGTSADLAGTKGTRAYVFEVRSVRADSAAAPLAYLFEKGAAPKPAGAAAVRYLRLKYEKKIRQVNCSRKKTGSGYGGLILVISRGGFSAPAAEADLRELAGALYAEKNSPPLIRVCLLSGESGAVFPGW